jgi:hypothetical protein
MGGRPRINACGAFRRIDVGFKVAIDPVAVDILSYVFGKVSNRRTRCEI